MRQSDFGPFTLGNMGDAWLAAAAFERDRKQYIMSASTQEITHELKHIAIKACDEDIMKYEERAQACFKAACLGIEEIAQDAEVPA